MSNTKQNDIAGDAASDTRRQMPIRARDDEKEQKQASAPSAHPSPAMRIYRHALESIFAMLNLDDLSRILSVSRSFAAAVRSMAPIHATIERAGSFRPLPPIARIVGSPLLRHVAVIQIGHANTWGAYWTPVNNASLGLLAQCAPSLTSLSCALTLSPDEPLILPANLSALQLQLTSGYIGTEIHSVLAALAALPFLSRLRLSLSAFGRGASVTVDVRLLAACRSLTHLELTSLHGGSPRLRDAQLEQICSSLGHLCHFSVGEWLDSDQLARLLHPPVTVRWRDIGQVYADERTGELLLRLPLTKLDLLYRQDTAHVDFLSQLQQLTSLTLDCWKREGWFIPADALLASLVRCICITELDLKCGFTSAQWSALFAKLTNLKKLTIRRGEVETLQCFATGPITQSLDELSLESLNLPPFEVVHLYSLRGLRTLHLDDCFSPPLGDAMLDSLSPPSSFLPALTELFQQWLILNEEWTSVKRQGPSFEWMKELTL